jgi:hypothetical protein
MSNWHIPIAALITGLIVIFLVAIVGSGPSKPAPSLLRWDIQAKSCIDAGGVPIRSAWDGELKTCEFPPEADT